MNKIVDFGKEIIENILKKSYKKIVLELSFAFSIYNNYKNN